MATTISNTPNMADRIANSYTQATQAYQNQISGLRDNIAYERDKIRQLEALKLQRQLTREGERQLAQHKADVRELQNQINKRENIIKTLRIQDRTYKQLHQYDEQHLRTLDLSIEDYKKLLNQEQSELKIEKAKAKVILDSNKSTKIERSAAKRHLLEIEKLEDKNKIERAKVTNIEKQEAAKWGRIGQFTEKINSVRSALPSAKIAERIEALTESQAKLREDISKYNNPKARLAKYAKGQRDLEWLESISKAISALETTLKNGLDSLDKSVDAATGTVQTMLGHVDARLAASGTTGDKLLDTSQKNLSFNRFISQKKYLDKLVELTDQGIAFNLEERAFLSTIAENSVPTYSANDAGLLRSVRLQQLDISNAEFGLEGKILELLNSQYKDSSYLNSMYDSVRSAMLDATSQLLGTETTAFDYVAQKWLGAMYSVGLSENTISQLASGINALGSGNVNALSGNEALQRLLLFGMQKSGKNYANILQNGLTAEDLNDVMKGVISYLQDIANNTSNKVVKAAYGDIFNLTLSDLRAISNLGDVSNVYKSSLDYGTAVSATSALVEQITSRTTMASQIQNFIDNATFGFGSNIAENPVEYLAWKGGRLVLNLGNTIGDNKIGKVVSTVGGAMMAGSGLAALIGMLVGGQATQSGGWMSYIQGGAVNTKGEDLYSVGSSGTTTSGGIGWEGTNGEQYLSEDITKSIKGEAEEDVTDYSKNINDLLYSLAVEAEDGQRSISVFISGASQSYFDNIPVPEVTTVEVPASPTTTTSLPGTNAANGSYNNAVGVSNTSSSAWDVDPNSLINWGQIY